MINQNRGIECWLISSITNIVRHSLQAFQTRACSHTLQYCRHNRTSYLSRIMPWCVWRVLKAIIYSPPCCFLAIWLSFFSGRQTEIVVSCYLLQLDHWIRIELEKRIRLICEWNIHITFLYWIKWFIEKTGLKRKLRSWIIHCNINHEHGKES